MTDLEIATDAIYPAATAVYNNRCESTLAELRKAMAALSPLVLAATADVLSRHEEDGMTTEELEALSKDGKYERDGELGAKFMRNYRLRYANQALYHGRQAELPEEQRDCVPDIGDPSMTIAERWRLWRELCAKKAV